MTTILWGQSFQTIKEELTCVYARERECDSKEVEIQVFGVKEVVHGGFQEAHN